MSNVNCRRWSSSLNNFGHMTLTVNNIMYPIEVNWIGARFSLFSTSLTISGKGSHRPTRNWSSVITILWGLDTCLIFSFLSETLNTTKSSTSYLHRRTSSRSEEVHDLPVILPTFLHPFANKLKMKQPLCEAAP